MYKPSKKKGGQQSVLQSSAVMSQLTSLIEELCDGKLLSDIARDLVTNRSFRKAVFGECL